jgi:hypothetical protein
MQIKCLLTLGLAAALSAANARADNTHWIGAAGGDWNTPGNWDNGVPSAAVDAVFTNQAPLVTSSQTAIAAGRIVLMNTGKSAFDFGAATVLSAPLGMLVGTNGTANLTLASGAIDLGASSLRIGCNASNSNSLDVLSGARIDCGALDVGVSVGNVGFPSYNALTVRDGGAVVVSGATRVSMREGNTDGGTMSENKIHVKSGGLLVSSGIGIDTSRGNLSNCSILIDGGVVTNNGALTLGYIRSTGSRFVVGGNGYFRNNGHIGLSLGSGPNYITVADGGMFDVNGNFDVATPGASRDFPGTWGDSAAPNNVVTVSNAFLSISGYLEVGYKDKGRNNTLILHEDAGETARIDIAGPLRLGMISGSNKLLVNGGMLSASAILTAIDINSFNHSTSNQVRIAGASAKVRAGSMNLRNKAALAFAIPSEGFAETPLVLTGDAAMSADSSLEIDAGGFVGTAALLTSATGSLNLVPPENISVAIKPGNLCKLTVESNKISIRTWIEGTLFIIK